ncbi:hypothetical protein PGTUg99_007863 [Puccinia graminis f. sp. tritici]|uniref:JmjC domain-containing protein n=1 Tax=Puccinia graminis f. sp. tritici TaxID=56615 RepID=A0A5B0QE15_PUCGR|nr:hypothetical protein PGTUg99_007863 [Puccinia graminis f. sp. tritici]
MASPHHLISTTPTSEMGNYQETDLRHRLEDTFTSIGPGGMLELLENEKILYQASPQSILPLDQPATTTTATSQHQPYQPNLSHSMISSFELSNQTDTHSQLINSSQPSADQPELFENLSVDNHPPPQVQRKLTTIENTHENQQIPNQKRPIDDVYNPQPRKASVPKNTRAKKPKQNRKACKSTAQEELQTFEELCDLDGNLQSDYVLELQTRKCTTLPAHLRHYRCSPCVGKQTGIICSFMLIRQWIWTRGSQKKIVGGPTFPPSTTQPSQLSYQAPKFPTEFNRLPTSQDLVELRRSLATILLPAVENELAWLEDPQVKFIGRRIDLVTKCDYCSATLFGAAWLCSQCGAEACTRCFELMAEQIQIGQEVTKDLPQKNIHIHWLQRLTTCTQKVTHGPSTHVKISHITDRELDTLRGQMLTLTSVESNHTLPPSTSPLEDPVPYSVPADLERFLYQPEGDHSESYIKIDVNDLEADPSIFDRLWSAGLMILVTGMSHRLRKDWTPGYFMKEYPDAECQMIESNNAQDSCPTTVKEFFDKFTKESSDDQSVWKLRDWPPEADFQSQFPDLFHDFEQALPIPDITTRFGIRNVAGHFPTNANVPDLLRFFNMLFSRNRSFLLDHWTLFNANDTLCLLSCPIHHDLFRGPKMYIAMKNSDQAGSYGSTVLHMDVADAVNIQTYAKLGDSEGCALWHLYHAKDSQALREFLYQHQADLYKTPVEEVKRRLDDPIHTTRIYINAEMRKTLREKYGVKGWEVKQKPGEAVFIPAYTAHQVCNLANCIKVAADFVSPHSIERCIKLTEEYRVQNHERRKPWREDLLQINQMLLYAFMSSSRELEEFKVKNLNQH